MDKMNEISLKKLLYQKCLDYVDTRINNLLAAMDDAQASANSETKSTAGDKHDTARAMMQLSAEQNSKHLAEANKLKQTLHQFDPTIKNSRVELGSVVHASNGNFFISISAGKLEQDGVVYFAISPGSPMGQALNGLSAGDKTSFNGNSIEIKSIC